MYKKLILTAAVAYAAALSIPALFLNSCSKGHLDDCAGSPADTTITIELVPDPCEPAFTKHTQYCMHPAWGGMFINPIQNPDELEEECLNPNVQTTFSYQTGIWTFRTALPTCTDYFQITDSECEDLHAGYTWNIEQTENFWEGTVQFPAAWTDCVHQIADEDQIWCFEIEIGIVCP